MKKRSPKRTTPGAQMLPSAHAPGPFGIASAEAQNTALRAAADAGDALGVVDADVAFHRELVRLTGSTRTARAHELLLAEAQLCMARVQSNQLLTAATIAGEHDAIVTAIRSGDRAARALWKRSIVACAASSSLVKPMMLTSGERRSWLTM